MNVSQPHRMNITAIQPICGRCGIPIEGMYFRFNYAGRPFHAECFDQEDLLQPHKLNAVGDAFIDAWQILIKRPMTKEERQAVQALAALVTSEAPSGSPAPLADTPPPEG